MLEHVACLELVVALRDELARHADAAKAPIMQAYMKSALPCYGVQLPLLRHACREVFAAHPLEGFGAWRDTVLLLWRQAAFREERYAAIELAGARRYREHQTRLEALPAYEEMIVTGAWWDLVDPVAQHRVGALLAAHPEVLAPTILAWSRSPDLWLRRAAIICQNRRRAGTDLDLLYACIKANAGDRNFFIRKAIGWALREYAKVDPEEVRRFVRAHEAELSPLSRREALKNAGGR